jgi:hypothetical protein
LGEPSVELVPPSKMVSSDWIGSMQDTVQILGDIVSPASEEKDWEALCD